VDALPEFTASLLDRPPRLKFTSASCRQIAEPGQKKPGYLIDQAPERCPDSETTHQPGALRERRFAVDGLRGPSKSDGDRAKFYAFWMRISFARAVSGGKSPARRHPNCTH
jgi:hypothetical protein